MEYVQLGPTGVRVSPICIGASDFGRGIDLPEAKRIMHAALDVGINMVDTADHYAAGASEEIVGTALAGIRDRFIVATKAFKVTGDGPNDWGTSRRHLTMAVEASLRRLNCGWIDLLQMHRFDVTTAPDETLRALDDLIHQGKVRYIGTSNYPAWRTVEALWASERLGLSRYVTEQARYSILDRRIEPDYLHVCRTYGTRILAYSPHATGLLGDAHHPPKVPSEAIDAANAVHARAADKGCTTSAFALAWLMRDGIVSPIVGVRTDAQVRTVVAALDVEITAEDRAWVDELVAPGIRLDWT